MTTPKYVKYKSYSGFLIRDNCTPYVKPQTLNHLDRAVYLTSLVEVGGKFGLVQSYDGAGMSAGLEHKIAVLPRTLSQGSLWGMLNDIRAAVPLNTCPPLEKLLNAFKKLNWTLDSVGVLRDSQTGSEVSGKIIRNEFTPMDGKVPAQGPMHDKARDWIIMFHELFNHPATFHVQIESAKKYLLLSNKKREIEAYRAICGVQNPSVLKVNSGINQEQDLAMCVYHSHSVNGPAPAKSCLDESRPNTDKDWPKRLIRLLGTRKYGSWKDTIDGNNRYDRTRLLAMKSDLWNESLFVGPNAIMPKDL